MLSVAILFKTEKHNKKHHTCKSKGTAESCVKHGDKYIRHKPRITQPDTAAHHYCHNYVRFQVKEMPYRTEFFAVALNSFAVLHTHLKEHKTKSRENDNGQQNIHKRNRQNIQIRENSQPCHIYSGNKPNTPGNSQQSAFFT